MLLIDLYLFPPCLLHCSDSAALAEQQRREEYEKQVKETREKLEWDRFLIVMAKGVHVRRHEAHHLAETVRLYTNNGGHTIKWAPKVAHDLAKQRQSQRANGRSTGAAILSSVNDSNGFDCCFSVCGCGDDLLTGNNYKASSMSHRNLNHVQERHPTGSANRQAYSTDGTGTDAASDAAVIVSNPGSMEPPASASIVMSNNSRDPAEDLTNTLSSSSVQDQDYHASNGCCFFNCGYHSRGNVVDMDIVAIHPSSSEDPTKLGYFGTDCLRNSRDVYNPSFTFSVVYQRPVPSGLLDRVFSSLAGNDNNNHRVDDHVSSTEDPAQTAAALMAATSMHEEAAQVNFNSVVTLDIECDTEESYKLLFHGFHFLHRRCVRKKYEQMIQQHNSANPGNILNYNYEDIENHRARGFHTGRNHKISLWAKSDADNSSLLQSSRDLASFSSPVVQRKKVEFVKEPKEKGKNPIRKLFKGTLSLDPLRAMGVGGGLFPVSRRNAPTMTLKQSQKAMPQAAFLGWRSEGTQIWSRLRLAGLETKVVYSWDLRRIILKVKCPPARLEEVAEKMHLRIRRKDGTLKVFKRSKRESFQACVTTGGGLLSPLGSDGARDHDHDPEMPLFRSSERQQIIDYIIRSKIKDGGAELDEDTHLGSFIVQRFPLHMYSRLEEIRYTWVTFWKTGSAGDVAQPWNFFSTEYVPVDPADIPVTSLGSVDNKIVENQYHYRPVPKISWKEVISGTISSVEHFFSNVLVQPLDNIAEYYGEGVAFYFAFLAFYTRWLIIPSIIGFVVFCIQMSTGRLDNYYCVPYAIMIMLWASFMLVFWRQKSSALAYRWGVLEYEVEETERPQFKGEYMYDDSTGEVHKVYPAWRRVLKYTISFPLLLCIMGVMLVVMVTVFSTQNKMLQAYITQQPVNMTPTDGVSSTLGGGSGSSSGASTSTNMTNIYSNSTDIQTPYSMDIFSTALLTDSNFWTVAIFYPCIYVILVEGFAAIVEKLAIILNNFENHRTQTAFMNRLILKVFSFRFVAVNMPLVYDMLTTRDPEEAYIRMSLMIFCQLTAGFYWAVLLDVGVPSLYQRLMLYHMKMNVAKTNRKIYEAKEHSDRLRMEVEGDMEMGLGMGGGLDRKSNISNKSGSSSSSYGRRASFGASVINRREQYLEQARSKCWEEALQPLYESFGDYTALVVQLGFVLLYAPIFPLAPLIALLNNICLIRLNAYKLTYTRQRPVAQKVSGIGVWEDVLQLISVAGVLANCALFGFISNILMDMFAASGGGAAVALLLFLFEHGILFFKYWLQTSVPMIPMAVQRAQQRERRSTMDHKRKQMEERRKSRASAAQRLSNNSFMSPENVACSVPFSYGEPHDGEEDEDEDDDEDEDGMAGGLHYSGRIGDQSQDCCSTDNGSSAEEDEDIREARASHPEQGDDEYYAEHLERNLQAARRNSHVHVHHPQHHGHLPRAPPTTPHVWSFMHQLSEQDASPLDLGYGYDVDHSPGPESGLDYGRSHAHNQIHGSGGVYHNDHSYDHMGPQYAQHMPFQSLHSLYHSSAYGHQQSSSGSPGPGNVVHHVVHHHHSPAPAPPQESPLSEYNETPEQYPMRAGTRTSSPQSHVHGPPRPASPSPTRRYSVERQQSPLATSPGRQQMHLPHHSPSPSPHRSSVSPNLRHGYEHRHQNNYSPRKRGVSFSHDDISTNQSPARCDCDALSNSPKNNSTAHVVNHRGHSHGHGHGSSRSRETSPVHHHAHSKQDNSPAQTFTSSPPRSLLQKDRRHGNEAGLMHSAEHNRAIGPTECSSVTPVNHTWTEINSPAPQSQLHFGSGGPKHMRSKQEEPAMPVSAGKKAAARSPVGGDTHTGSRSMHVAAVNDENSVNSLHTPLNRGKAVTPSRIKPAAGGKLSVVKVRTVKPAVNGASTSVCASGSRNIKPSPSQISRARVPTTTSVNVNVPAAIPKYQYYDEEPVNPFEFVSAAEEAAGSDLRSVEHVVSNQHKQHQHSQQVSTRSPARMTSSNRSPKR